MFGLLRLLLALMVVYGHLMQGHTVWIGEKTGTYAVFGFYMLSGYLMTLILHEQYGFTLRGLGRFGLNRLLRIYPAYAVAALLGLVTILMSVDRAGLFHAALILPGGPNGWLGNLTILGLHPPGASVPIEARFSPPGIGERAVLLWAHRVGPGPDAPRRGHLVPRERGGRFGPSGSGSAVQRPLLPGLGRQSALQHRGARLYSSEPRSSVASVPVHPWSLRR